jgi:hypothetical protein
MKKWKIHGAIIALGSIALGVGLWWWVDQRCSPPYALDGGLVVGRRVYSMGVDDADEPPATAPQLDGWPVLETLPMSADLAREVREVLYSHSTYMAVDSTCFEPGMAVSFGTGADQVDVVICVRCDRAVFYRAGQSEGRRLTIEGGKRLVSIYERLFKRPAHALDG